MRPARYSTRALWAAKQMGPDAPLYPVACRELDRLDYWFDEHPWR